MANKKISNYFEQVYPNSGDLFELLSSGANWKATLDNFSRFLNNSYFLQNFLDPYYTDINGNQYGRFHYINGNFLVSGNLKVIGSILGSGGLSGDFEFNNLAVNTLTVSGVSNLIGPATFYRTVDFEGQTNFNEAVFFNFDTTFESFTVFNGLADFEAGFQIAYTGLIDNLNADMLDNQHGSYYRNAANLTGVLPSGMGGGASINSTPPTSITGSGASGSLAYDANYLYVCISTNRWKRTPLGDW